MNPNPEQMSLLTLVQSMAMQIINSPASLMVVLGLSIVAYLLEVWPKFDSRYIKIVVILLGPFAYCLFAPFSSVPKIFPFPVAVLTVNGLLCGLISLAAHVQIIRRLMIRFGGDADTQFFKKPKGTVENPNPPVPPPEQPKDNP